MHQDIWFLQLEVYNSDGYVNINELFEKFHQMYNDQSEQLEMKHIEYLSIFNLIFSLSIMFTTL